MQPLSKLLTGLPAQYIRCTQDTHVQGLVVDSRSVVPGAAFLALRGQNHDGHQFLSQAFAAGAKVAIVEADDPSLPTYPYVCVPNTADAYPFIAANFYDRPGDHLRLAAVTGTNGKTTTTYLIAAILAAAKRKFTRIGTVSNWIVDRENSANLTTPFPLDLQAMLAQTLARGGTDGIMEVSSHALSQGRVKPLAFTAIGFTSFSQDHLDFHKSMQEYLEAKCLLARDHLKNGGFAVAAIDVNSQAEIFLTEAHKAGGQTWRTARTSSSSAEIFVSQMLSHGPGIHAKIVTPAGEGILSSPLIGAFNLDNILVSIGLGIGLGISLEQCLDALKTATGAPGRLERVQVSGVHGPTVFVDYAHTPDAIQRVLETVRPLCSGKLVIVLGCGGDRDPKKRAPMGAIAARLADYCFITSDNPRSEDPMQIIEQILVGIDKEQLSRVTVIVERSQAIAQAIAAANREDTLIIAGKGHERYQMIGSQKLAFDDREHAMQALTARLD